MKTVRSLFKSLCCWLLVVSLISGNAWSQTSQMVPIRGIGVAPWLGQISSRDDLLEKIVPEKANLIRYIQYDLGEAVRLQISSKEAEGIVNLTTEEAWREISIPDSTSFLSMGWKSRITGRIMRTSNPVFRLGRPTEGYMTTVILKDYQIKYVFLKECGNLCLLSAEEVSPPEAKVVPLSSTRQTPLVVAYPSVIVVSQPAPPPPPPPPVVIREDGGWKELAVIGGGIALFILLIFLHRNDGNDDDGKKSPPVVETR